MKAIIENISNCRQCLIIVLTAAVCLLAGCRKDYPEIDPDPAPVATKSLPQISITTPSHAAITSKNTWMTGASVTVIPNDGSGFKSLGKASIKGRGNTTWGFPKKPYAIKLDTKAEIFGLPKGARFDLLANYIDITCMRNAIALEIARRTKGQPWTPHCEFVELLLNEQQMGNYLLTEHIKIAKSRVDLKEGGYILELDTNFDEEFKFHSTLLNMPVMIKDYEGGEVNSRILAQIQTEFNELEAMVVSDDRETNGWQNYIDMDSFIDWWFVYELAQCGEPNHPKSSYMYKEPGGKLHMGPVWDFDWGTFRNGSWVENFRVKECIWYKYLFKDPAFVKRVKEKWAESKADFMGILDYIDETAEYVKRSAISDKSRWPMTTHENDDETIGFDNAISRLKQGYQRHLEWIDRQIYYW